ncbi:translation initiation factor IF-2-like [Onychomys torridus]|uniref:translation initiation factor IF-2-like n=1 Tax=Onychomys torridus TaxID=38674 RepID=UPI00167F9346|nr:translation initiation factor IF-2-like [Onychomys torridus]
MESGSEQLAVSKVSAVSVPACATANPMLTDTLFSILQNESPASPSPRSSLRGRRNAASALDSRPGPAAREPHLSPHGLLSTTLPRDLPAPHTGPRLDSASAPDRFCCSRCHGDWVSREPPLAAARYRGLPRTSRAIVEVGSSPGWGWGFAAHLLSPSRLPVLGGGKEGGSGGSGGAGPADQLRRGRLGEREAAARQPGGTCGGGGGGGSRGARSRNRFGAGEGRRVRAREEAGSGWEPRSPGAPCRRGPARRGAADASRRAGGPQPRSRPRS